MELTAGQIKPHCLSVIPLYPWQYHVHTHGDPSTDFTDALEASINGLRLNLHPGRVEAGVNGIVVTGGDVNGGNTFVFAHRSSPCPTGQYCTLADEKKACG